MVVKHCPITKVNSMLDATLMPAPAARVSRGWISLQHNRNRVGNPPDRTYNAERSGAPCKYQCRHVKILSASISALLQPTFRQEVPADSGCMSAYGSGRGA